MTIPGGVTRFPNGVSSNQVTGFDRDLPFTNPAKYYVHTEDFASWYLDGAAASASDATKYSLNFNGATINAAGDMQGGWIDFDLSAALGNSASLYGLNRGFMFDTNIPVWFEAKFQVISATLADCAINIGVTNGNDIDPPTPDDGFYFIMNTGPTLQFGCTHDGDQAFLETVGTLVSGEDQVVSFYFDGAEVEWWYQGERKGSAVVGDLPLGPVDIFAGIVTVSSQMNLLFDYFWIATEGR